MELWRILYSRRYATALSKLAICLFVTLFVLSMVIRRPSTLENQTPDQIIPSDAKETETGFAQNAYMAKPRFIAQYYEEEGAEYDNYCLVEMESRRLRVKEMCEIYLNSNPNQVVAEAQQGETNDAGTLEGSVTNSITPNPGSDRRRQILKSFMGQFLKPAESMGYSVLEKTELSEKPTMTFVQIEENRRMFLCAPHKVGSQTWRHFFEQLKFRDGMNETEIFRERTEYPPEIASFTKAYQVRHPFERLLSAFRFIFEREAMRSGIQDLKKEIISMFPFLPSEMEEAHFYNNETHNHVAKNEYDVIPNFRQFAEHVIRSGSDFGIAEYPVVTHWLPYYFSCSPCKSDFQPHVVIRMESILKDTLCFLDTIPTVDWDDVSKLHHVNQSPHGHSSNKQLQKKYFSMLPKETMLNLYERYKPDFLLYGYDIKDYLPHAATHISQ